MDRQKLLMIFGGAWLSAALLTWFVYARMAAPKTQKLATVIAAARDLPAGSRLRKSDLKRVEITDKDLPRTAVTEDDAALDRVTLYPVNTNETLLTTKLTSRSSVEGLATTIESGKRAISVPVTDTSSAGGLIQPRSRVDVLFTRTGSIREALTSTILQDVTVLSIGRLTEAGQQFDPKAPRPQSQSATLLVTPEEAAKLELAKNHGKISLSLRNPLDRSTLGTTTATAETLDPAIFAGASRAIRASMMGGTNVRDPKAWAELTGGAPPSPAGVQKKELPKPRLVVDVYRGDKHVQEIFE